MNRLIEYWAGPVPRWQEWLTGGIIALWFVMTWQLLDVALMLLPWVGGVFVWTWIWRHRPERRKGDE